MLFRFRVLRSPQAAEAAGGTMTLEAPAEKAAVPAASEGAAGKAAEAPDPKATPKEGDKAAPAAKTEPTDWDVYKKMAAKFEKNPNARATKRELEVRERYEGKDESTIKGYQPQDKPQDVDDESAPAANPGAEDPKDKPVAPPIPKELEDLVGEKSPLKAKTLAEFTGKVKGLLQKVEKMNGDFGAVGRVMQEVGVENLQQLHQEVRGAKRLHTLVQDLKAGKPEALKFMGWDKGVPFAQPGRAAASGPIEGMPEGILDEALAQHLHGQLAARDREIAEMKRLLTDRFSDVDSWKQDSQRRAAETQRVQQVNEVVKDVGTLVQSAPDLWDSKKHGPLNRALEEYYGSKDGDAYNPGLERILQILAIAKEKRLDDLDVAYAYWARKNTATLQQEAARRAREPFTGKQASVGLSDQQNNHNGQFKEYTRSQVLNMGKKGYPPIPPEWVDESGTLIKSKIPAIYRGYLFETDEE